MPTKVLQKITAWGFSRWKQWTQCPASAKFKYVLKVDDKGTDASHRGTSMHDLGEEYVMGSRKTLDPSLKSFAKELKALRDSYKNQRILVVVEESELNPWKFAAKHSMFAWAFDSDWKLAEWFDKDAWLRAKVDIHTFDHEERHVVVIDLKSGRKHLEHKLQLDLYALTAFLKYPRALTVAASMWYVDLGEEETVTYQRSFLPKLQKDWMARVKPMLADTRFPTRPGRYCSWCSFAKSKGGPCELG